MVGFEAIDGVMIVVWARAIGVSSLFQLGWQDGVIDGDPLAITLLSHACDFVISFGKFVCLVIHDVARLGAV